MYLFESLNQLIQTYLPEDQIKRLRQAYLVARDAHEGQTRSSGEPYITHPVAVACILAEMKLDYETLMAALLHDAPEYVIGDLISPFKAAIGADYKALEAGLLAAIHRRFGLPVNLPNSVNDLIKRADTAAAYIEAIQLAGFSETEAKNIFGRPRDIADVNLKGLEPNEASQRFIRLMQKHARAHMKQS